MTKKNQLQIIRGLVEAGQNLGSQTGANTANLDVSLAKNLSKGLYTCTVNWQNRQYPSLLYYGHNSLSQKDCLEVHILNFSQDIYGQKIEIVIKNFIRPEIKFNSLNDLKNQIKKDLTEAKKLI